VTAAARLNSGAALQAGVAAPSVLLGSFDVQGADPLHDLLRAARMGADEAVAVVLGRVRERATALLLEVDDGVIVTVPSHLPDARQPLLEEVAGVLAATRGWARADGALRRCSQAPEAKTAPVRDAAAEIESLEWRPPAGKTIVLLDDVVRSGISLQVCAQAIRATGDRRPVVGLALALACRASRTAKYLHPELPGRR
jgi:predicted amidophosphoribosyltransferase